MQCRKQNARQWALRLYHEKENYDDSIFLTLTYDDSHLPDNNSLVKRDLQLFYKRLRKRLSLDNRSIRYFSVGEYGDISQRPHYHSIIFGLSLNYTDRNLVIEQWPYCDWNVESIRDNSFGVVTPASIQYVTGYIFKKFSGIKEFEEYEALNRKPVFRIMSQGIGRDYVDNNSDYITDLKHLTMHGKHISLPRYYVKRLNLEMSDISEHAKEKERDDMHKLIGLYNTYDDLVDSLNFEDRRSYDEKIKRVRRQHELNLEAAARIRSSKI